MNTILKVTALAAAGLTLATAVPATAATAYASHGTAYGVPEAANAHRDWYRGERASRDDYRRGYRSSYRQPSRNWRGNDGRDYCRKGSGTTGLLIGGAAGALLGREIDGGRDRTLGTVLGAAGGALLGREVDRGGSRCR